MSKAKTWSVSGIAALTAAGALAFSVIAIAAPLTPPKLLSPGKGGMVRAGKVTVVVKDPEVPSELQPIFVTLSKRRTLNKEGRLTIAKHCKLGAQCAFFALTPWHGHPGLWHYTSQFDFPGYWATTPGRYFWQAQHVAPMCKAPECKIVSSIGSFIVRK